MNWPSGTVVPPYFREGMTLDHLLEAHKSNISAKTPVAEETGFTDELVETNKHSSRWPHRESRSMVKKKSQSGIQKLAVSARTKVKLLKRVDSAKKNQSEGVSVSVKNIPFKATDGELRAHFSHIGRILRAKVDRDGSKSLGSGTVTFGSRKEALSVIESMQNTKMGDRPIYITLA